MASLWTKWNGSTRTHSCALPLLVAAMLTVAPRAEVLGEDYRFVMDSDPDLTPVIQPREVLPAMVQLWADTLQTPPDDPELMEQLTSDMRKATTAVTKMGAGKQLLAPVAAPLLLRMQETQRRVVRQNAARALVALDYREAADHFKKTADDDIALRGIVLPALARWRQPNDDVPALWRDAISDQAKSNRERLLAIQCAEIARDDKSASALLTAAMAPTEQAALRLAAASAYAACSGDADDPLSQARELAADETHLGAMLAARLLSHAKQEASARTLQEFVTHPSMGVSPIAASRLHQQWPDDLIRLAPELAAHASPTTRASVVQCVSDHAGDRAPKLLGLYIADRHPDVRALAGRGLIKAERDGLREPVEEQIRAAVAGDAWQGHSQAAIVATEIKYIEIWPEMLELLNRGERRTREAAAYFLGQRLPEENCAKLLEHFKLMVEFYKPTGEMDLEMTLLMQAFGRTGFGPAEAELERFVPKTPNYSYVVRAAAVWCIGKIHAGKPNTQWANAFIERVQDVEGMNPEFDMVRKMSAVSIGRMKNVEQLAAIRAFPASRESGVGQGLGWCQEQLSGEPMDWPPPWRRVNTKFFLMPLVGDQELTKASQTPPLVPTDGPNAPAATGAPNN